MNKIGIVSISTVCAAILLVFVGTAFGVIDFWTILKWEANVNNSAVSSTPTDVPESTPPPKLTYKAEDFENGDIIFRRGISLESRVIMSMDGDFGFSHAGIVRKKDSKIEVIHASFAEEGQTEEIIINEPLEKFVKPSSATSFVVYRFSGEDKKTPKIALDEAVRFLAAKIPFDKDFDLSSEDKIYCSELIWRSYKKAGIDLTNGKFDHVPYYFGNSQKDFILPSSLLNTGRFTKIWESSN